MNPKPVDPQTLTFLAEKKMEVAHATSKAVQQVPNYEHYQVIITLEPDIKKALPASPNRVITLEWTVKDPSKVQGSAGEVRAAYEETFRYIREQIKDLAEAILDTE